jgi:hypothetical protein
MVLWQWAESSEESNVAAQHLMTDETALVEALLELSRMTFLLLHECQEKIEEPSQHTNMVVVDLLMLSR